MARGKGQPSLLTPALLDRVREALPRCLYIEVAADMIGVSRRCFQGWLKLGRQEQKNRDKKTPVRAKADSHADLCCRLLAVVKATLAEAEASSVEHLQDARERHWQAAAWLLERRHPERWSATRGDLAQLAALLKTQQAELDALRQTLAEQGDPADGGDPPAPKRPRKRRA